MSLDKKVIREVVAPIRDATANPVNVDKGLVFYNNDGRQVGERTQGEIIEKVIPSGTPLIEDGASYNHMIIQNVASFDASASASLTQGAIIYAGVNAAALQYKSSTSVAMLRKHSFDVNIVIADIREFTFKVGDNSFNLSFGKDYFGLTKNVYAQLANSKGSSVPISPNDNYSFLMLNIEKGVIKKVSIGINTYRAETQTNVEIAFKINTVARSIIDATAVPSDVASGKTFYNNDGKQVGNGKTLKIYNVQIGTGTQESITISGTYNLIGINDSDGAPPSYYCKVFGTQTAHGVVSMFLPEFENITRVKIDGVWYNMGTDKNTQLVFRFRAGGTAYYYANLQNRKLSGSTICLEYVNALEYY